MVYKNHYLKYKKDLKKYLSKFKDAKILEIWCWMWNFAYFCSKLWVVSYTGIDVDDFFFEESRNDFKNYDFIKISFQDFLKQHSGEFDIIFVSHVFEHLDEKERVEMVENIYNWLRNNWLRINYMPNANALLYACSSRYSDITHKTIYNDTSFTQVVYSCKNSFEIENFNIYIGRNIVRRVVHLIFRYFTKIYCLCMWQSLLEIYTWEFISILTKK